MSIYLCLSTLEDFEIVNTVKSALENADKPKDIYVGVAATVRDFFYDSVIKQLQDIDNVSIKKFDPVLDRGIGNGRNNARFAYNAQDYIVQVDSHTHFQSGWDTFIINLFNEAVEETGSERTIVTGYLGPYSRDGDMVNIIDKWITYCIYLQENASESINIKRWIRKAIKDMLEVADKQKKFFPANKIGADFMIGNNHWAEYSGLPRNLVFWEEEVIQTILLLDSGFSLAFPNVEMPMTHRHLGKDEMSRQSADRLYMNNHVIEDLINENIKWFVDNYPEACKRYADYSGYDLASGTVSGKIIPNKFCY